MTKKTILACVACGSRNYTVPSNGSRQTDRLEVKKFCRYCNAHTVHKQTV